MPRHHLAHSPTTSSYTSRLPTQRHSWLGHALPHGRSLLGTCSCGRACVLGSWHCSGDSTALRDVGQPGHLQPLLASSPGTPAGCVPGQGCQAAAGGGRVGWGWLGKLPVPCPLGKGWMQSGAGSSSEEVLPSQLGSCGVLRVWVWGAGRGCFTPRVPRTCALPQLALQLQQTEQ